MGSGYKIFPEEWDGDSCEIVMPQDGRRRVALSVLAEKVADDVERLRDIVYVLELQDEDYTVDTVAARFRDEEGDCGFLSFANGLIKRLYAVGRDRTAEAYTTTINSFGRFRRWREVAFDGISSIMIMEYERWLIAGGVSRNASSYYMRNMRAIYNRAAEKGITVQRYPFAGVYTGIDKTPKRALTISQVRLMKDADQSSRRRLELTRDLFLFSLYTRGMSFVDMAYLKKENLRGGVLSYRRHKTGQLLTIKWEKCMTEIVEKYARESSPYMLPLIMSAKDEWKQYKSAAHRVNRNLKNLGERLGFQMPLTMYVARHTWASIARSKNIPLAVISEGMGHDSERTTRIYLAALDTTNVDKANSLVIKSL